MANVLRKVFSEEVERKKQSIRLRKVVSEGASNPGNHEGANMIEAVTQSSDQDVGQAKVIRHAKRPIELLPRFPTLTWTHSSSSMEEMASSVGLTADNARLVREILKGLNQRLAERCDVVLGSREEGTMSDVAQGRKLSTRDEDVRRRHEHVKGMVECMPALLSSETDDDDSALTDVRNALVGELQDLYSIMWSMECRKYDVCSDDIHAAFAWLKLFEDATRVYLAMSEACVYSANKLDECDELTGELLLARRHALKRHVVQKLDALQPLKRMLLALDRKAGSQLRALRAGVDAVSTAILRLLQAESRQLPALLAARDDALWARRRLLAAVRAAKHGRELLVLLSRGARSQRARAVWNAELRGAEPAAARVLRCHAQYVAAFQRARREYCAAYERLVALLDARLR